jgi:uncharacterized membrane protein
MFNSSFANFLWTLLYIYLVFIVIMMMVRVFSDIFTRENLSGWGKAGWIILIFVFPFIGLLIYIIARPKNTEQDKRMMEQAQAVQSRLVGGSSADDIAKAKDLLDRGAITQDEFNALKAKALA